MLHVIIGPMFASKSTTLIAYLESASAKESVYCVNSIKDTRCNNEIKSHNGKTFFAKKVTLLSELEDDMMFEKAAVIGIDEAQFFPDILDFVRKWHHKKTLYVSGLDGTSEQEMFDWLHIIPYADTVQKLHAYCTKCSGLVPAPFTRCKVQKNEIELVGGADLYYPVCRKHLQ